MAQAHLIWSKQNGIFICRTGNIANAALDYYVDRGTVYAKDKQPLLATVDKSARRFLVAKNVRFIEGCIPPLLLITQRWCRSQPANIQRVNYAWKEHHAGIS